MACNVKRAPPKHLNFSLSTSASEKKPHDVDRRECVGVDVSFHVPVSASRKRISARSSARVSPRDRQRAAHRIARLPSRVLNRLAQRVSRTAGTTPNGVDVDACLLVHATLETPPPPSHRHRPPPHHRISSNPPLARFPSPLSPASSPSSTCSAGGAQRPAPARRSQIFILVPSPTSDSRSPITPQRTTPSLSASLRPSSSSRRRPRRLDACAETSPTIGRTRARSIPFDTRSRTTVVLDDDIRRHARTTTTTASPRAPPHRRPRASIDRLDEWRRVVAPRRCFLFFIIRARARGTP